MTTPAPHASYDIPRGTVLGKYEVLRKLATGGMAEIYVARVRGTAGFEKLVVLKRILPNVAQDPAFVKMFLDEARLAATLSHPNIADVYDVGEVDGTYFFAMEYVHGEDARTIRFATRKRDERPPLAIALAIIQGTAAALDYAHEKTGPQGPMGLVHRDISASNILVSYDGAVKLVDFGIARATASETKTRTGTLKGKIPYMSPEQCRGHQLDRRSDLFSLGTVMYELTVGRRPFRGETDFQIMEQIVHYDVRPPSEIDPDYPPQLDAIVRRLLARDVDARYQTADALLHDLEEFTQSNRLHASPKAIGKYMRALFAEKIDAWEAAERDGVTLGQHVLQTITNQSHQSGTPSSAMLPPADLPPITGPYPYAEPPTTRSTPIPTQAQLPVATLPSLRPSRRGPVIVGAAMLTLAGAGGGYYWMTLHEAEPAKVAPAPIVEPTPPPTPEPVKPPVVEAEPPPVVEARPVAIEPPVVEPAPADTKAAVDEPPVVEPEPVAKPDKRPGKKPVRPKPEKIDKPPPKPDKPPPKPEKIDKPPPKPEKIDKPPPKPDDKEKPWDPNSPFLPPPS